MYFVTIFIVSSFQNLFGVHVTYNFFGIALGNSTTEVLILFRGFLN